MKRESTFTDTLTYSSLQPGKWDLYQIDKLLPTNLTLGESLNYHPVYHPEGRYLVFTSERSGQAQLYCIDTENANQTPFRLTDNTHHEDQAAFSPNGELIYFVSTKDNGVADIYELPFHALRTQQIANARNLTKGVHNNLHPDISPCGKWMVFSSNREHDAPLIFNPNAPKNYRATDIFKMHLMSGELTRLTDSADWDGSPVWSHTGQEIYFYSTRGEDKVKTPHIYSMNADGSEIKMILPKEKSAVSPKLMPNGRLAFTVIADAQYTIASIKPDGTDLQEESPADRNYYGAFFHPKTSQCIAYGDGPKNPAQQFVAEPRFPNEKPPGIGRFLSNRYQQPSLAHTELCGIRGFFPTYDATRKQVLCVEEFNKVVLIDIDGNNKTLVYQHDKNLIGIHWSSDRTWFVAAMGAAFTNEKSDIWKISIDGVVKQNLTSELSGHKMFPKISNNNQSIVFCNRDGDNTDVWTINNDGNGLKLIRKNATLPAFSPDGQKIVYSSKPNYHLYLIDSSGNGEPEPLTNNRYADLHAEFSPDGSCVVFTSERGGLLEETPLLPIFSPQPYGDIYSVEISSKIVTRITESKWECSLPNWTIN